MKIKNVLIGIVVFILIITVLIILKVNNKNKNFTLETISSVEYMVYKDNSKCGVINKNGDIIIDAIYDEIDIPNPSKDVFICKYDFNQETQEYSVRVLNASKEPILYQYYIVEAINLNGNNSEIPFEKSVLKFKQKRKIWDYRF